MANVEIGEYPKNEDTILNACMRRDAIQQEQCPSAESNAIDKPLCTDTLYDLLLKFQKVIKTFNMPELFDAINHLMKALKPSHRSTKPTPSHLLNKQYETERKECELLLILEQLAESIHRILNHLKYEHNL